MRAQAALGAGQVSWDWPRAGHVTPTLARHGTRNPGAEDITAMATQLPELRDAVVAAWLEGRGTMAEEDIARLMEWTFDLDPDQDKLLTE